MLYFQTECLTDIILTFRQMPKDISFSFVQDTKRLFDAKNDWQ